MTHQFTHDTPPSYSRHGQYYRYRLDIVRLAVLSIDFYHPRVSVSVLVLVPPFYPPGKMKVFFMTFCHYLLNGISFFPFMGHFWKMPLKNKISPFPTLHFSEFMGREDGGFFLFFSNLAGPRMFCFFGRALYRLGKW